MLAGLIGLVAAVPFSAPDGTGMQWDELVLGCVAASASWALFSRARTMSRAAARPWRLLGVASAMFAVMRRTLRDRTVPAPNKTIIRTTHAAAKMPARRMDPAPNNGSL